MPFTGPIHECFQEDRLSRVEDTTLRLVSQVSEHTVEIKSLKVQVETGQNNIIDKLGIMSNHLGEKITSLSGNVDIVQKAAQKMERLEAEKSAESKLKRRIFGGLVALLGSAVSLLVEHYLVHGN
jgi:hypothetical protein